MISYDEALHILLDATVSLKLPSEVVRIGDALGRIGAKDILAPIANPSFDNSAMDGYAVRTVDVASSAGEAAVRLTVVGHIAAGELSSFAPLLPGKCYEIMTGAPVPKGCDGVIPVEKVLERASSEVWFPGNPKQGENIRRAGEDFQIGDTVLEAGVRLRERHILSLAALGVGSVEVMPKPWVGILSTGREIVDDLCAPLEKGQVYNATGPYLTAALEGLGAQVVARASVPDESEAFKLALGNLIAQGVHLIISTGAVSAGSHDFIPEALREIGAEIMFHKVAIKPGKPILFARLPHGALYFGLPGNPASTAAGFRFFVHPVLQALHKESPRESGITCVLSNSYRKDKGLRHFMRASVQYTQTGQVQATILEEQKSFMVRPFVEANAWAVIPETCDRLDAGETVRVILDAN